MNDLKPENLSQFTGTGNYWRGALGLVYSDGVRYMAEHGGAYWLLDVIASYQPMLVKHQDERLHDLQFWTLKVNPDKSAVVTCVADSGEEPVVRQEVPCTDFPLDTIDIWVGRDVLGMVAYLKSEH